MAQTRTLREFLQAQVRLMKARGYVPRAPEDLVVRLPLGSLAKAAKWMVDHADCNDCCFDGRHGSALTAVAKATSADVCRADSCESANDNEGLPVILNGIDVAFGPHRAVRPGLVDYLRVGNRTLLAFALAENNERPACACSTALFGLAPSARPMIGWKDDGAEEACDARG